jgi:putative serine protease PepD
MSQTTNDHDETQYAWARRPNEETAPIGSAHSAATDTAGTPSPHAVFGSTPGSPPGAPPAAPPAATQTNPGSGPSSGGYPGSGSAFYTTPPESNQHSWSGGSGGEWPPGPDTGARQPSRPGWGGVIGVGLGAALLSSLLTAGVIVQTQDNPVPATTTSASSPVPAVKAPVTSSSTSNPDWGAVAKAVEPSVVAVQVSGQNGSGEGSGVILDKTGRIVTNNHVVSGAGTGTSVKVVLSNGNGYEATVVGTDPSTDLAVIKITKPPSGLTPAVLGSSSSVAVGDPVMAVGNPLGLAGTVTTGIVSATDRPVTTQAESTDPTAQSGGETVVTNAIQTDAAVNPGNSGGALVDAQGRVIGIPSSIASLGSSSAFGQSSQSGSIGLGFAIPIDEVRDVTSQLIKGGTVQHSWLGVSPQDGTVTVNGASRDSAVLRQIVSGSPAAKAGLKVGDSIIAVDGDAVNSATSLVGQLRQRPVGTSVTLTVVRSGKESDVKVTLGARPTSQQ